MSVFSGKKIYVPPSLDNSDELRSILSSNGALLVEAEQEENSTDRIIYVVDSFDGTNDLFSYLCSKGIYSIISSSCVYETIKLQKPLPDIQFPLFSRVMEEIELVLCNSANEKPQMEALLKYMGCKVSEAVTDSVDYVLASKVGSRRYQAAVQKSIPIVRPLWVKDIWREQKLISHAHYVLPPFHGCIISVTGVSASTRSEVSRLTTAYGGEYTPNLTKRCTHLLARFPQGIKYRYALEWGIHCVSVDWFFDSINCQARVDENQHTLSLSEASKKALFSPTSASTSDLSRLSPALRKKHLMQMKSNSPPRHSSSIRSFRNSPESPAFGNSFDGFSEGIEHSPLDLSVKSSPMSSSFSFLNEYQKPEEMNVENNLDTLSLYQQLSTLLQKCDETIKFYKERKLDANSLREVGDVISQFGIENESNKSSQILYNRRRCSVEEIGEDESMDPQDSFDVDDLELDLAGRRDSEAQDSQDEENIPTSVALGRFTSASIPCTTKSASPVNKL